jgi:hypothetical protein
MLRTLKNERNSRARISASSFVLKIEQGFFLLLQISRHQQLLLLYTDRALDFLPVRSIHSIIFLFRPF